jgi:hypothetical protein
VGLLWIVGPDAFADDPDLVFQVEETSGKHRPSASPRRQRAHTFELVNSLVE